MGANKMTVRASFLPPGKGCFLRYRADITAGSPKMPKSRVVADLMLRGVDAPGCQAAVGAQNLLWARNPATAIRLGDPRPDRFHQRHEGQTASNRPHCLPGAPLSGEAGWQYILRFIQVAP
jgi:hypothetical protein